jgi:hypothetical protein
LQKFGTGRALYAKSAARRYAPDLIGRVKELDRIANGEEAEPPGFELMITKSRW